MNDEDRFLERQSQTWHHHLRLGTRRVLCVECSETDPRCFIGDLSGAKRIRATLIATCERCRRRLDAPTDAGAIAKKWEALRQAGVHNERCHCGEDNPFCLEADHLDGRATSDRVVGRCINCHLKRTSRQLTEYPLDGL